VALKVSCAAIMKIVTTPRQIVVPGGLPQAIAGGDAIEALSKGMSNAAMLPRDAVCTARKAAPGASLRRLKARRSTGVRGWCHDGFYGDDR
jgi:hypothetical protein